MCGNWYQKWFCPLVGYLCLDFSGWKFPLEKKHGKYFSCLTGMFSSSYNVGMNNLPCIFIPSDRDILIKISSPRVPYLVPWMCSINRRCWKTIYILLTHFLPMFHFYRFWKRHKWSGFLMFSADIGRRNCSGMGLESVGVCKERNNRKLLNVQRISARKTS